jgi:hypothetical protein
MGELVEHYRGEEKEGGHPGNEPLFQGRPMGVGRRKLIQCHRSENQAKDYQPGIVYPERYAEQIEQGNGMVHIAILKPS